ncbi:MULTISPECIES: YceI family protein [Nocardia]|uniref:YceI family protein n=1 Tax=Nocardia TaxID=1817 RepID=UPI001C4FD657|nr:MULTISPECIES: YceI family protein [Nocardia]
MNWIMVGEQRPTEWVAAPQRCTARFQVGHFGRRTVHGSMPVLAGRLTVGPDGQPQTITGVVDLAAIDTGHPRRDRDLRKPGLLDLDRHPRMSFVADDITGTDGEWRVAGVATVRGRDVPLVFTVTRFDLGGDTVAVRAEAVLDRRQLGIKAPEFLIGRWVTIAVHVVLRPDYRSASASPVNGLPIRANSVSVPEPTSTNLMPPPRSLT